MPNAKCRTCDRAVGAGAHCTSCAAGIMAQALNPFFGDGERSIPGRSRPSPPSSPLSGSDLFGDGIPGQLAKEVQTDKRGALTLQAPALMERQD